MVKTNFDGIVEAVRLDDNKQLLLARFYERRGPIVSDHLLINRIDLVQRLKDGQRILIGKRLNKMGSNFETGEALLLTKNNGLDYISTQTGTANQDQFKGVPVF
ncbi:MAG: hypothetical protein CVU39_23175 [Chloroflexi bacterium HGW-Chloroflexi-10]|nr:MAG: hypothetical protein CVU39_23175 [Chloroflexi bacterium HGW-Chloroflexi-10]